MADDDPIAVRDGSPTPVGCVTRIAPGDVTSRDVSTRRTSGWNDNMMTHGGKRRRRASRSTDLRRDLAARMLRRTILVDQILLAALRVFRRARTAVVLGFVSDATLERLGEYAYAETDWYRPHGKQTWPDLFDWEAAFLEKHAPPPPARVLVGGAGAGREPYHLARMRYDVTAFDPIPFFVNAMRRDISPDLGVQAWHARYQDLPLLRSLDARDDALDLAAEPPFAFGIMGWTSLSHVLDADERVQALKRFTRLVDGPVLLSVFTRTSAGGQPGTAFGQFRQRLPGRNKDFAFDFQISTGVYRTFVESEIDELCERANLVILDRNIPRGQSHAGWVVVTRRT